MEAARAEAVTAGDAPVLVVDPDAGFRGFVGKVLRRGGFPTEAAASGEEALALAERLRPRLVVLEVRLADISGYEVCEVLRAAFGAELAIAFTSADRTEPMDRVAGLKLGADDYLGKPVAADELLARARALVRRLPWGERTNAGGPRGSAKGADRRGGLTPRELEVLGLLAGGMSQAMIAQQLVISPKTAGKHIEHILQKLDAHSRAEAVAMAYKRELVDVGQGRRDGRG